ncbi:MAG: hypothetical protein QM831_00165 [Kofleriaceae bacterium]
MSQVVLPDSSNLDGNYLWLGPSGAATYIDGEWDTVFGIDASILRVREHEPLAVIGGTIGATHYASRSGGRLYAELVAGTELDGHAVGVTAGPLLDLSDTEHPKVGGSVGLWGFVGIAPYVRAGAVQTLGSFVEIGIHIALPVIRR